MVVGDFRRGQEFRSLFQRNGGHIVLRRQVHLDVALPAPQVRRLRQRGRPQRLRLSVGKDRQLRALQGQGHVGMGSDVQGQAGEADGPGVPAALPAALHRQAVICRIGGQGLQGLRPADAPGRHRHRQLQVAAHGHRPALRLKRPVLRPHPFHRVPLPGGGAGGEHRLGVAGKDGGVGADGQGHGPGRQVVILDGGCITVEETVLLRQDRSDLPGDGLDLPAGGGLHLLQLPLDLLELAPQGAARQQRSQDQNHTRCQGGQTPSPAAPGPPG